MARKILRTPDVSAKTGIPVGTLRWWRHMGEGPRSFTLGKKTVAYFEDDVDAWIAEQYAAADTGVPA